MIYASQQSKIDDGLADRLPIGKYKFKITETSIAENGAIQVKMKIWTMDGKEAGERPKFLHIQSKEEAPLKEVDRFLMVTLGTTNLNELSDLLGKSGIVVMQHQEYLNKRTGRISIGCNPLAFGGFFNREGKSASEIKEGKQQAESIEKALSKAEVLWKLRKTTAPEPVSTPETEENMPF